MNKKLYNFSLITMIFIPNATSTESLGHGICEIPLVALPVRQQALLCAFGGLLFSSG
jgi:hypothetical protein